MTETQVQIGDRVMSFSEDDNHPGETGHVQEIHKFTFNGVKDSAEEYRVLWDDGTESWIECFDIGTGGDTDDE